MPIYSDGGILKIILTFNGSAVGGVDIDGRHFGTVCQPIHMNPNHTAIGLHGIGAGTLLRRFNRQQYPVARTGNNVIDVFVETQARDLALLQFIIHIDFNVLAFGQLKRWGQTFSDSGNSHKDGVTNYLTVSISKYLVVMFVIELERLKSGEIRRRRFAYRVYIGQRIGECLSYVGLNNQLLVCLAVLGDIDLWVSLQPAVFQIYVQSVREGRSICRIWVYLWIRTRIITFLLKEEVLIVTIAPSSVIRT